MVSGSEGVAGDSDGGDNSGVPIRDAIMRDRRFEALARHAAEKNAPIAAHGLWGSIAPILAGLLAESLGRPLLFVTAHHEEADQARDEIETVLGRSTDLLPAWETLPGEGGGAGEITAERSRLCEVLRGGGEAARSVLCVAPVHALIQPVPSIESLDSNSLALRVGQALEPEVIVRFLADRGFQRLDQVERPGDFALRGGILDVFATAEEDPVRMEFFGDQVESIRRFELGTGRSTRTMDAVRITLPPDASKSRPADTTSFVSYLSSETIIAMSEPVDVAEMARTILDRLGGPIGHYSFEGLSRQFAGHSQLMLSRFQTAAAPESRTVAFTCRALPEFELKSTEAVGQLVALARKEPVHVFCDNAGERERLAELIEEAIAAPAGTGGAGSRASPPRIESVVGTIHRGLHWGDETRGDGFWIVPHHELFHRYTQKRRIRKVEASRPIESFLDLEEGDYVVHVTHGIGRFVGLRTMKRGDARHGEEFLTIRFADEATIHVPTAQVDLVQKYVGSRGGRPTLSKIGGTRWQSTKARVEEALGELASELLRVQASRESKEGVAFPNDTHWQKEFEDAFLYSPTPDQVSASVEIKNDMARSRPMDRLLCGDVGYGKTELAMRAAFKAAEFGKQVAVLVPTTVLAEQHYRSFKERMADYPFRVERLNRFRSPKEQRDVVQAARKGQIDVLIGTHRLLSRDVGFADLGLVIVDEEQRFGVEHKERLKFLREMVDVLTLSATPIPRTLHMSMIGLRDISCLATAPMDRRSISTRVCTWEDALIREAILRELNRDGQLYFVHNRVHSIQSVAARLAGLVPDARYVVGHGQMSGEELEDVMLRFVRHEADVLVSTNIIESGLDIPNANTIFIDRADQFGLADLHQLRGRVGRYKHRAYCYLLLSPDRPMTSTAAKRLKAIEEFSELGSGFRIAMRDLEIRGAGNILGPEQSGHIAAVGYELYCQLLEKTVKRMRGEHGVERIGVHVELGLEAGIPRGYVPSDRQRIECYRRFAACRTPTDVQELEKDLTDAYGRIPESVAAMLDLTEIKVRAVGWKIKTILRREPDVIFSIEGEVKKIEPLFAGCGGSLAIVDGRTIHWRLPDHYFHGNSLPRILRNLFRGESTKIPAKPVVTTPALEARTRPNISENAPQGRSTIHRGEQNARPGDAPARRRGTRLTPRKAATDRPRPPD